MDEDGHGRHFAFDEGMGASLAIGNSLSATVEYEMLADLHFDLGANAGLDHDAPDAEVYFGISHRF